MIYLTEELFVLIAIKRQRLMDGLNIGTQKWQLKEEHDQTDVLRQSKRGNREREMAKDPAFLFYPGDWNGGTILFSRHEKGAYIDLLMAQFHNWALSISDIGFVLKADFPLWEEKLKTKFAGVDEDGRFFNVKLREEQIKRRSYSESRRENKSHDKHMTSHMTHHMTQHMENENEDKDINKNTTPEYKPDFEAAWKLYPKRTDHKEALRHFKASVKTKKEFDDLLKAIANYKQSRRFLNGYIKDGSTFFNNWKDWVEMPHGEGVTAQGKVESDLDRKIREEREAQNRVS